MHYLAICGLDLFQHFHTDECDFGLNHGQTNSICHMSILYLLTDRYITGPSASSSNERLPLVAGVGLLCAAPASGKCLVQSVFHEPLRE